MGSRTKNTKRNIITSYIYILLNYLFQFISRSFMIHYLGEQYLGLSSLFSSILQFLNLTELGFAGAIVYNMYKPLADNDVDTVCALLNYYKVIYRKIGTIILIAGVSVLTFIPKLISGSYPTDINIRLLYLLYLSNTVISYFLFAYKTSLLEATQRIDYVRIAHIVVILIQYPLQIAALVLFRNYYLFVIVLIISSGAKNVVVAWFAKKYYPQYVCRGDLTESIKYSIITRVKGLMIGSIGTATSALDSVVISSVVGLTAVAQYNNYIIIMGGVGSVIAMLRKAMQPSVGNSVAKETVEKNYNDLLLWQFMFSFIASWCVSCLYTLYQPFMKLWMGEGMLLPAHDVVMICVMFNVSIIQHSYYLYLSGGGLWWELRWPYIFEMITNLLLNIILGKFFGISGVIFASLFVTIVSGLIWQCKIILSEYFKKSIWGFLKREILYFAVSIVVTIFTYLSVKKICSHITGVVGFTAQAVLSVVISGILLVLIYYKTLIFKKAFIFMKRAIKA